MATTCSQTKENNDAELQQEIERRLAGADKIRQRIGTSLPPHSVCTFCRMFWGIMQGWKNAWAAGHDELLHY
jgi:hypothetical protein